MTDHGERDYDVIGVSALNLDRILRVGSLDRLDNELVIIDETASPGGSAANTICGLARLGLSAALIGAVGADRAGEALLANFHDRGIPTRLIKIKNALPTGESICLADRHGQRLIAIRPGANDGLTEDDITGRIGSLELPARLIHMSSFVSDLQFAVQVKIARAVSPASLVSLSPGAFYARRGIAALTPLAARCDVLFVNRDEICTLMAVPADGYAVAAQRFLSQFTQCEAVAVTLGAGEHAGVHRITSRVFRRSQPDFRIASSDRPEVTDATGAGDAFAAGYLYGLLTGEATERCALFGHVLAQFALAGTGACASLPSRAEFRRAVELSPTRVITGLSQTSPAGRIGRQQFDSAAVKAGDAAAVGEVNLPGMRLDNLFPVP